MLGNHARARSISDAGWSPSLAILVFTAADAGKQAVAVPPASTSQQCSGCQREVWKGLSVRWHHCPYADCRVSLHRDHNAALTILALGTKQRERGEGHSPQASTWTGGPSVA